MASIFDACSMPLCPIDIPPQATTAHECHGVPMGAVAALRRTTGTTQLTSPASVDPPSGSALVSSRGYTLLCSPTWGLPVDAWIFFAKDTSSSV
jgi:hypothetical protein